VTGLAILLGCFDMAMVKRVVETKRLPRRHVGRLAKMAVPAGDRPGFCAFVGDLLVTADAVPVIEVHGLLIADVLQGFVRGRQVTVILNDVAEGAILLALRHEIRMQIVRELHRGSF
jgi:hypothetical protein